MDNHEIIKSALVTLLTRDNKDAFVVFEHVQSGKFIQFAGSASEPLFLDLPIRILSDVEFDRASAFFRRAGVASEAHVVLDEPGGSVIDHRLSFNYAPRCVEEAADLVVRVFREIFDLEDGFALIVTEK